MQAARASMVIRYHGSMSVPAFSDPAIVVTAAPADPEREREEWRAWWSTLPTVERSRPAAEVLAEIRDED